VIQELMPDPGAAVEPALDVPKPRCPRLGPERVWAPRRELPWPGPLTEAYLARAQDYQRRTALFPGWRELLVQLLAPRRGDTVLDLGCGPGLNFAALYDAVGPHGTIVAIDESPELLAVAAALAARRGWGNVELINAPIEEVQLSVRADAALLCAAPGPLASPTALSNIFAHLRPGAHVAAGGWKWPTAWLWPLRAAVTEWQRPVVADFTGFDQPWRLLARHVSPLHVSQIGLGAGYLAHHTPCHR
jgi:demethylmenaquinone methyltransferase/2-methoxy-6-polyprenyl-1,4-benzoquinol methylase